MRSLEPEIQPHTQILSVGRCSHQRFPPSLRIIDPASGNARQRDPPATRFSPRSEALTVVYHEPEVQPAS